MRTWVSGDPVGTEELTAEDLPDPLDHSSVLVFARSFPYTEGDRLEGLAKTARSMFYRRVEILLPADELRACLFFEQRCWSDLGRVPDESSWRFMAALLETLAERVKTGQLFGFLHDPIEDDPIAGPLIARASEEAEQELTEQGLKRGLGYCHAHWQTTQRILEEKYNIAWRSPAEMNPRVIFD